MLPEGMGTLVVFGVSAPDAFNMISYADAVLDIRVTEPAHPGEKKLNALREQLALVCVIRRAGHSGGHGLLPLAGKIMDFAGRPIAPGNDRRNTLG